MMQYIRRLAIEAVCKDKIIVLTNQRQYLIELSRCRSGPSRVLTKQWTFASYAMEVIQLLVDIVSVLRDSYSSIAMLQHHLIRNFLQLFKDPIVRLRIIRFLVYDQLVISKTIPPPDPALRYDWEVRNQLMGKKLR